MFVRVLNSFHTMLQRLCASAESIACSNVEGLWNSALALSEHATTRTQRSDWAQRLQRGQPYMADEQQTGLSLILTLFNPQHFRFIFQNVGGNEFYVVLLINEGLLFLSSYKLRVF